MVTGIRKNGFVLFMCSFCVGFMLGVQGANNTGSRTGFIVS